MEECRQVSFKCRSSVVHLRHLATLGSVFCVTAAPRRANRGRQEQSSALVPSSTADVPAGSWTCPSCNNVNWPRRTHCNKSGCGLPRPGTEGEGAHPPGSWACAGCKNINWAKRTHCNRSNCGLPRGNAQGASLPAQQALQSLAMQLGFMHAPHLNAQQAAAYGQMIMNSAGIGLAQPAGGSGAPPGSWTCPGCKNVNWPKRTQCNKAGCALPRPAMGGMEGMGGMGMGMGGMGMADMGMGGMQGSIGMGGAQGPAGMGGMDGMSAATQLQEYHALQQLGMPHAMQQHGAMGAMGAMGGMGGMGVGMPMPMMMGAAAGFAGMGAGGGGGGAHPEGSWACPSCNNVNWPKRTTCNKSTCGRPRPAPSKDLGELSRASMGANANPGMISAPGWAQ